MNSRKRSRANSESDELAVAIGRLTDELATDDRPSDAEILARFPQFVDELQTLLPTLRVVANLPPAQDESIGGKCRSLDMVGTLGDFKLLREVGRGGMGIVYEAEQISLSRRVALKVLPYAAILDDRLLQRFATEAQAAASLHHEHIVPVHGVGRERGIHYYAMQFIDGQSLAEVLATESGTRRPGKRGRATSGDWNCPESTQASDATTPDIRASVSTQRTTSPHSFYRHMARIGADAAKAIHYAHSRGVLHRDIKPGNLMLDHTGKLWVTDFGLAQVKGREGLTMTGELVGTLRYMSPEQLSSKTGLLGERTDVYSLGATLFELIVGRPLFDGNDHAVLVQQVLTGESSGQRFKSSSIPPDLQTILGKAIERDPADRYQSAGDLADDLQCFIDGHPIKATPPGAVNRGWKWAIRHRALVTIVSAAILVTLSSVSVMQWVASRRIGHTLTQLETTNQELADANRQLEVAHSDAEHSFEVALDAVRSFYNKFRTEILNTQPELDDEIKWTWDKAADVYRTLIANRPDDRKLAYEGARILAEYSVFVEGRIDAGVDQAALINEAADIVLRQGLMKFDPIANDENLHVVTREAETLANILMFQLARGRPNGIPSEVKKQIKAAIDRYAQIVHDENTPEGLRDLGNFMELYQLESNYADVVAADEGEREKYRRRAVDSAGRMYESQSKNVYSAAYYANSLVAASAYDSDFLDRAIEVMQESFDEAPEHLKKKGGTHLHYSRALSAKAKTVSNEEAIPLLSRAVGVIEPIWRLDPNDRNAVAQFANDSRDLAVVYCRQDMPQAALECLSRCEEAILAVLADRPINKEFTEHLSTNYLHRAIVQAYLVNRDATLALVDEAVSTIATIRPDEEAAVLRSDRLRLALDTAESWLTQTQHAPAQSRLCNALVFLADQCSDDDDVNRCYFEFNYCQDIAVARNTLKRMRSREMWVVDEEENDYRVLNVIGAYASGAFPDLISPQDFDELLVHMRAELGDNHPRMQTAYGWEHLRGGEPREAIAFFRKAEEVENERLVAFQQIGTALTYAKLDRRAEAATALQDAMEMLANDFAPGRALLTALVESATAVGMENELHEFLNGRLVPKELRQQTKQSS